jgi:hypothetical protein
VIYSGSLGALSADMIAYFSGIPGVRPIPEGYNPATWMLEVSTLGAEERMGLDLAEVYRSSDLCGYAWFCHSVLGFCQGEARVAKCQGG